MPQSPIEFKGSNFTLSVIYLNHPQPEVIRQALQDKINQAPEFLHHAPVIINISRLQQNINWKQIQTAVNATGLRIIGVSGCKNEFLKKIISCMGLPVLSEGKEINKWENINIEITKKNKIPFTKNNNKTVIFNELVRSGQQIYARNTDLVVTNNVSAGAELVADGNIHIYGIMKGRALAGATGDIKSQIFCTNLFAALLSIAGKYWIMDQIPEEFLGKAACLYLKKGMLNIQALN
ncbi:septum site-determining protein MinC [Pantoea sp. Mhis]|uniref:septum site-determining protein MinC n=1 Tax=Pantoea sp. Mhis TaxID=2576759 RepID=UPI00135A1BD5|nr:septum site-determining protein MinC [Pantoea sp. Mhis]MXP56187.1 septum site-determining protein MinC [Pantoea sp. Mhis]